MTQPSNRRPRSSPPRDTNHHQEPPDSAGSPSASPHTVTKVPPCTATVAAMAAALANRLTAPHKPLHTRSLFAVRLTRLEGKQIIAGGKEAYLYVVMRLGVRQRTTPFATVAVPLNAAGGGGVGGLKVNGAIFPAPPPPPGSLANNRAGGKGKTKTVTIAPVPTTTAAAAVRPSPNKTHHDKSKPLPPPAHLSPARGNTLPLLTAGTPNPTYRSGAPNPAWPSVERSDLFYWDGRSSMPDVEFLVCARPSSAVNAQRQTVRARAAALATLLEDTEDDEGAETTEDESDSDDDDGESSTSSIEAELGLSQQKPGLLNSTTKKEQQREMWRVETERTSKKERRAERKAAERKQRKKDTFEKEHEGDPMARLPVQPAPSDKVVGYARVRLDATMLDKESKLLVRPPKMGKGVMGRGAGVVPGVASAAAARGRGIGGFTTSPVRANGPAVATAENASRATEAAPAKPSITYVQLGIRNEEDAALLRLYGTLGRLQFGLSASLAPSMQSRIASNANGKNGVSAGQQGQTQSNTNNNHASSPEEEAWLRRVTGGQTSVEGFINYQEDELRRVLDRVTAHGALNRELQRLLNATEATSEEAEALWSGLSSKPTTSPLIADPLKMMDVTSLGSTDNRPSSSSALPPAAAADTAGAIVSNNHSNSNALSTLPWAPKRGCTLIQATFHPLDPILDLLDVRSYLEAKKERELEHAVRQLEVLRRVRQLDANSRKEWWAAKQRKIIKRYRKKQQKSNEDSSPAEAADGGADKRRQRQQEQQGSGEGAAWDDDATCGAAPVMDVDAFLANRGERLSRLLWSAYTAVALHVCTTPSAGSKQLRDWPSSGFVRSMRGVDPAQAVFWRTQQSRKWGYAQSLASWVLAVNHPHFGALLSDDHNVVSLSALRLTSPLDGGSDRGKGSFSDSYVSQSDEPSSEGSGESESGVTDRASRKEGGMAASSLNEGGGGAVKSSERTKHKHGGVKSSLGTSFFSASGAGVGGQKPRSFTSINAPDPNAATLKSNEAGANEKLSTATLAQAAVAAAAAEDENGVSPSSLCPPLPSAPADANGFLWDRLCMHLNEEDLLALEVTVCVSAAPPPPLSAVLPPAPPANPSFYPDASFRTIAGISPPTDKSRSTPLSGAGGSPGTAPDTSSAPDDARSADRDLSTLMLPSASANNRDTRKAASSASRRKQHQQYSSASANAATNLPPTGVYAFYPTEELCVCRISGLAVVAQLTLYEAKHKAQPASKGMDATAKATNKIAAASSDCTMVPLFFPCYAASRAEACPEEEGETDDNKHTSNSNSKRSRSRLSATDTQDGALCGWLRFVFALSPSFSLTRLRELQARQPAEQPPPQCRSRSGTPVRTSTPLSQTFGNTKAALALHSPPIAGPTAAVKEGTAQSVSQSHLQTARSSTTQPPPRNTSTNPPRSHPPGSGGPSREEKQRREENPTALEATYEGSRQKSGNNHDSDEDNAEEDEEASVGSVYSNFDEEPAVPMPPSIFQLIDEEAALNKSDSWGKAAREKELRGYAFTGATAPSPRTSSRTDGDAGVASVRPSPALADMTWTDGAAAAYTASVAVPLAEVHSPLDRSDKLTSASALARGVDRDALLLSMPTAPVGGFVVRVDQVSAPSRAVSGEKDRTSSDLPADAREGLTPGQRYHAVLSFPSSASVEGAAARAIHLQTAAFLFQARSKRAVKTEGSVKEEEEETEVTARWGSNATYVLESCGPYLGLPLRVDIVALPSSRGTQARPALESTTTSATTAVSASTSTPRLIGSFVFHYSTLPFVGRHRFVLAPPRTSLPATSSGGQTNSTENGRPSEERSPASVEGRAKEGEVDHIDDAPSVYSARSDTQQTPPMTITLAWSISAEVQQQCLWRRLRRLHRESLVPYAVTPEGVKWVFDQVRHATTPSTVTALLWSKSSLPPGRRGGEDVENSRMAEESTEDRKTLGRSSKRDQDTATTAKAEAAPRTQKQQQPSYKPERHVYVNAEDNSSTGPLVPRHERSETRTRPHPLRLPHDDDDDAEVPLYALERPPSVYGALPDGRDVAPSVLMACIAAQQQQQQQQQQQRQSMLPCDNGDGYYPESLPPYRPPKPKSKRLPHAEEALPPRKWVAPVKSLDRGQQRLQQRQDPSSQCVSIQRFFSSSCLRITVLSLQNLRLPSVTRRPQSVALTPYVVVRYQSESRDNYSLSLPATQIGPAAAETARDGVLVYFTVEFEIPRALLAQPFQLITVEVRDVLSRNVFGVAYVPIKMPVASSALSVPALLPSNHNSKQKRRQQRDRSAYANNSSNGNRRLNVRTEAEEICVAGETVTHIIPVSRPLAFDGNGSGNRNGSREPRDSAWDTPSADAMQTALPDSVAPVVGELTVLTTVVPRPSLQRQLLRQPVYLHVSVLGARQLPWSWANREDKCEGERQMLLQGRNHSCLAGATPPLVYADADTGGAPDAYVVVTVRQCVRAVASASSSSSCASDDDGDAGGYAEEDAYVSRPTPPTRDEYWTTREYRSLTIARHRSPLWYLELPPLLCGNPTDLFTFTVYQADEDGFDTCIGECQIIAGELLDKRRGRSGGAEVGGGAWSGAAADGSGNLSSTPQMLQLPLGPRRDITRGIDLPSGGDFKTLAGGEGSRGTLLLEWSFASANFFPDVLPSTPSGHMSGLMSQMRGSSSEARLTRGLTSTPAAEARAVVVEVQLDLATALALELPSRWAAACASRLRDGVTGYPYSSASHSSPSSLSSLFRGASSLLGVPSIVAAISTDTGLPAGPSTVAQAWRTRLIKSGGAVTSSYALIPGVLQLSTAVVQPRWPRRCDARAVSYTELEEDEDDRSDNNNGGVECVAVDAQFPCSVTIPLSQSAPPSPIHVGLWLRFPSVTPRPPATPPVDGSHSGLRGPSRTTSAATSVASYSNANITTDTITGMSLTPQDVFLGETSVHVTALIPCESPLQDPAPLTTLLRPRRDPRYRSSDIARANSFAAGLGTLSLRTAVYPVSVYEARQRFHAKQRGWQARLTLAVQEATDFESDGVYAVEVQCGGTGERHRSRVLQDRNPRFHETFAFTILAPTEMVEVRLLEWPPSLLSRHDDGRMLQAGEGSDVAGVAAAQPRIAAVASFAVECSREGDGDVEEEEAKRENVRGDGAAVSAHPSGGHSSCGAAPPPVVHTTWLTLRPVTAADVGVVSLTQRTPDGDTVVAPVTQRQRFVSAAGVAPKLLIRWRVQSNNRHHSSSAAAAAAMSREAAYRRQQQQQQREAAAESASRISSPASRISSPAPLPSPPSHGASSRHLREACFLSQPNDLRVTTASATASLAPAPPPALSATTITAATGDGRRERADNRGNSVTASAPASVGAISGRMTPMRPATAQLSKPPGQNSQPHVPSSTLPSTVSPSVPTSRAGSSRPLSQQQLQQPLILNVLWHTGELISFLGTGSSTARDVFAYGVGRCRSITDAATCAADDEEEEGLHEVGSLGLKPLSFGGADGADGSAGGDGATMSWLPPDAPLLGFVRNGDYVQVCRREDAKPGRLRPTGEANRGQLNWSAQQDPAVVRHGRGPAKALRVPDMVRNAAEQLQQQQQRMEEMGESGRCCVDVISAALPALPASGNPENWMPVRQERALTWLTDRRALAQENTAVLQRSASHARNALVNADRVDNTTSPDEMVDALAARGGSFSTLQRDTASPTDAWQTQPGHVSCVVCTFLYESVASRTVQQLVQWVQMHHHALSGFCRPVEAAVPQTFHVMDRLFRVLHEGPQRQGPGCIADLKSEARKGEAALSNLYDSDSATVSTVGTTFVEAVEVLVQGSASSLYAMLRYLSRARTAADTPVLLLNGSTSLLHHYSGDTDCCTRATEGVLAPLVVIEEVVGYVPVLRRGAFQLAANAWESRQVWTRLATRDPLDVDDSVKGKALTRQDRRMEPPSVLFYVFANPSVGAQIKDRGEARGRHGCSIPGFFVMDLRESCESH